MPSLQVRRWLLLGCVALFALPASAGLVRYDVAFQPGAAGPTPAFDGFMVFDDQAVLPDNIWPFLSDWEFDLSHLGGPVIDPSNTVPWDGGYFQVDAAWNYERDYLLTPRPPSLTAFPCFSTTGECNGGTGSDGPVILSTLSFLSAAIVSYPGFNEDALPSFNGTLIYSGPIFVPLPATVALFLPALLVLILRRWHTQRRATSLSGCQEVMNPAGDTVALVPA
ncbi:MAG: hypothetical protein HKN19_01350 [Halioglobus sp.]|nr:hypothetical protein [Halioglobus sp.]